MVTQPFILMCFGAWAPPILRISPLPLLPFVLPTLPLAHSCSSQVQPPRLPGLCTPTHHCFPHAPCAGSVGSWPYSDSAPSLECYLQAHPWATSSMYYKSILLQGALLDYSCLPVELRVGSGAPLFTLSCTLLLLSSWPQFHPVHVRQGPFLRASLEPRFGQQTKVPWRRASAVFKNNFFFSPDNKINVCPFQKIQNILKGKKKTKISPKLTNQWSPLVTIWCEYFQTLF